MSEHFEDVWEYAERTSNLDKKERGDLFDALMANVLELKNSKENQKEILGKLLFNLCSITLIDDLNSYTALREYSEKVVQEMLDNE